MSQTVLFFLTAPVVESFSSGKKNKETKLLNYSQEEGDILRLKQHHSKKLKLVKRNIYILYVLLIVHSGTEMKNEWSNMDFLLQFTPDNSYCCQLKPHTNSKQSRSALDFLHTFTVILPSVTQTLSTFFDFPPQKVQVIGVDCTSFTLDCTSAQCTKTTIREVTLHLSRLCMHSCFEPLYKIFSSQFTLLNTF